MREIISEYIVKLEYDKDHDEASQIFFSLSKILSSFAQMDTLLGHTVSGSAKHKQKLISVDNGSIISKILSSMLVFDENENATIGEKPNSVEIENYIKKSKKQIIDRIQDIDNPQMIHVIENDVYAIAKEHNINNSFDYEPMDIVALGESLVTLTSTVNDLSDTEKVIYKSDNMEQTIPKGKVLSLQSFKETLIDETLTHKRIELLKIKKPDYLGTSQWNVKIKGKFCNVEISDKQWLKKFHNKEFYLGPGDSIRAEIIVTDTYDKNKNHIGSLIEVSEILEIIEGTL